MSLFLAIGVSTLLACSAGSQNITFCVTFDDPHNDLPQQMRDDLERIYTEAGHRWAAVMDLGSISSSIEIEFRVNTMLNNVNGKSDTSGSFGVIGGRVVYEQGVAHELRTGHDPNDGDPDAVFTVDPNYLIADEWFDPDPASRTSPVPANRYDALSTALHEFGHVLVYNGSAKDIGIPLPGEWSVFERWIEPGVGGGPPHFVGPAATAVWGKPIELAIGDTCHLGNHDPAATTLDPFDCQLMSAGGFDWGRRYDISKLDRAILRDCGIPTVPSTP